MNYNFLANATAVSHITIVFGVLIGILISFRYKRFRPFEVIAMISIILLWSYYGNCPLTILEQHFRNLAHQNANLTSVGFLPYYANRFFGIALASSTVVRSTYATGVVFSVASIEWCSPYINMEIFKLRKTLKKIFGKKKRRAAYR